MTTSARIIQLSIQYSSIALVYYDYILTLDDEVKYIWRAKFRLSNVLYFFCRYAMLANIIYLLAVVDKLPKMSCDAAYQVSSALSVLGRASILFILGVRTYAVFDRNRIILVLLWILGLLVIILATLHVPYIHCKGSADKPIVVDLLSIFTVVFEVFATVCATFRTIQAINATGSWKAQHNGIMFLILEQGLLYFGFVTLFTTAALILNFTGSPTSFIKKLLNALTIPISGLMTARFLLHLRKWEKKQSPTMLTDPIISGTPTEFATPASYPDMGSSSSFVDEFGRDPLRAVGRPELY
ncbi:hypothetical protein BDQ12DRAFT_637022 [Crucibulum laeve]|uniref:DUF6533 domain-containing protein n=1 Tax=Crucibulum laeve TaxID=68775 RepID=A0A5C3LM70_9AGAR|nr:hypothetical protein BDQ12DRAFT_637022 [Crucibulum laeve]